MNTQTISRFVAASAAAALLFLAPAAYAGARKAPDRVATTKAKLAELANKSRLYPPNAPVGFRYTAKSFTMRSKKAGTQMPSRESRKVKWFAKVPGYRQPMEGTAETTTSFVIGNPDQTVATQNTNVTTFQPLTMPWDE